MSYIQKTTSSRKAVGFHRWGYYSNSKRKLIHLDIIGYAALN